MSSTCVSLANSSRSVSEDCFTFKCSAISPSTFRMLVTSFSARRLICKSRWFRRSERRSVGDWETASRAPTKTPDFRDYVEHELEAIRNVGGKNRWLLVADGVRKVDSYCLRPLTSNTAKAGGRSPPPAQCRRAYPQWRGAAYGTLGHRTMWRQKKLMSPRRPTPMSPSGRNRCAFGTSDYASKLGTNIVAFRCCGMRFNTATIGRQEGSCGSL